MTGPFLQPHQMANPCVYVVDQDVQGLSDLMKTHAAEMSQWARVLKLKPTSAAILAILSYFRGLRGGRDGCGMQVSVSQWTRILGRSERAVQEAFEQLTARGYIFRRRRYVKLDKVWTDARGRTHTQADIRWATYLSKLGAIKVMRLGETKRLKVIAGKGLVRMLAVCGLVENLFESMSAISKAIATRVTDAVNDRTPSVLSALRSDKEAGRGTNPDGFDKIFRRRRPNAPSADCEGACGQLEPPISIRRPSNKNKKGSLGMEWSQNFQLKFATDAEREEYEREAF